MLVHLEETPELISPAHVARILGVTPARVRQLADSGKLTPATRTELGRLFRRSDVEALIAQRAAAGAARK